MTSTFQVLKLLRDANPGRRITEDLIRACIRRGDAKPPGTFAGRLAWTPADIRALAAALGVTVPREVADTSSATSRTP